MNGLRFRQVWPRPDLGQVQAKTELQCERGLKLKSSLPCNFLSYSTMIFDLLPPYPMSMPITQVN